MNNVFEQEIRFHLLQLLSRETALSQRDMAREMGISLGKVNYCVTELAKKGLIKIIRFKSAKNKIPYSYILTPRGLQEKARMTVRFLRRKIEEYEEIERQIQELALDLDHDLEQNLNRVLSKAPDREERIDFSKKEYMDLLSRIPKRRTG